MTADIKSFIQQIEMEHLKVEKGIVSPIHVL